MKKKILIAGASVYGLENHSDDAMFGVFCQGLHRQIPDLEIVLLARHPRKSFDRQHRVHSIQNLDHETKSASQGRWYYGLNSGDSTGHLRRIWKELESSDLLVIGGGPFIDTTLGFNRGLTPYVTLLITLAKFLNKPIMIHGVHLGRPLATEAAREMTRFCIGNARLVTVREPTSLGPLQQLGLSSDNLVALSDTAYGITPAAGRERGLELLAREGIAPPARKLVGITFRHMYWLWKKTDWDYYASTVARLADFLIDSFGVEVLFLPHCTYDIDHFYEDDRAAAADIHARMAHHANAYCIWGKHSLEDILSLFPLLDMAFGNRRHTAIFGALHGVPSMAVGEAGHVQPVMDQLGLGHLFVDKDHFEFEKLQRNLVELWTRRDQIRTQVAPLLPALVQQAHRHAQLASQIIL